MWLYESTFLGIRMRIPDGWKVRMWPDDGVEELAQGYSSEKPLPSGSACAGAIRPLMYADLYAPGSDAVTDARIELQACNEGFLSTGESKPLMEWNVNGNEILYHDDFREGSPENMYYRFPRWQIKPGLWLYATILASGRRRFDYVLSIFRTIAGTDFSPTANVKPLFECEPWNLAPSFYRLNKSLDEDRPLVDLTIDSDIPDAAINANKAVLSGIASPNDWAMISMRRKSRVLSADCYYGPEDMFSVGIFSSRAIDLFKPNFDRHFSTLPCIINDKPFFFLIPREQQDSCLDINGSEIKRFQSGRIMEINRYRFKNDLVPDPLIFAVPEDRNAIFGSASIPEKSRRAGLKGIAFHPVDGNGREHTCE